MQKTTLCADELTLAITLDKIPYLSSIFPVLVVHSFAREIYWLRLNEERGL